MVGNVRQPPSIDVQLTCLFEREYRKVLGWIYRKVLNKVVAEDIVQTACLQLWERRATIRNVNGDLLYKTVNFRWMDYRKTQRENVMPLELVLEEPATDTPIDELAAQRDLIHRGMAVLTDDQRRVVRLKAEGLKGAAIGEVLGVPESAVKARYTRAVDRAKRAVDAPVEPYKVYAVSSNGASCYVGAPDRVTARGIGWRSLGGAYVGARATIVKGERTNCAGVLGGKS